MRIAVLNKSTRVTDAHASAMTLAVQMQLDTQVSVLWERLPPYFSFFADPSKMQTIDKLLIYTDSFREGLVVSDDWDQIILFDSPDQANVLGYHSEGPDGRPYGKVFVSPVLDNGGGILDGGRIGVSIASVLSHEAVELFIDATVNGWYDGPAIAEGSSYAAEACDPVQGDCYDITLLDGSKVLVSNFVGPAWFDMMAPRDARRDWMGTTSRPFEIARGGYCMVRSAPGSEREVFAAVQPPAWMCEMKRHPAARSMRRRARAPQGKIASLYNAYNSQVTP